MGTLHPLILVLLLATAVCTFLVSDRVNAYTKRTVWDVLAEYELYQNFDSMIGDKTAIYISHRLSSTRFCEHVAMFRDGHMIEYGTHEGLLQEQGAYAEMFHAQAQYYV